MIPRVPPTATVEITRFVAPSITDTVRSGAFAEKMRFVLRSMAILMGELPTVTRAITACSVRLPGFPSTTVTVFPLGFGA